MILAGLARKMMLIRLRSDANMKLLRITERLRGLSRYASNIADGLISMREAHDVPSDLFCRQMQFATMANAMAYNIATQQTQYMQYMPGMQQTLQNMPPEMQQAYLNNQFWMCYQEARKQAAQEEQRVLHQQEEELTEEKEKLTLLVKEYDAELDNIDKSVDKSTQQFYKA